MPTTRTVRAAAPPPRRRHRRLRRTDPGRSRARPSERRRGPRGPRPQRPRRGRRSPPTRRPPPAEADSAATAGQQSTPPHEEPPGPRTPARRRHGRGQTHRPRLAPARRASQVLLTHGFPLAASAAARRLAQASRGRALAAGLVSARKATMMIHEITEKAGRHKKRKRSDAAPGRATARPPDAATRAPAPAAAPPARSAPPARAARCRCHPRWPKRGFSNANFKKHFSVVNLRRDRFARASSTARRSTPRCSRRSA